MKSKRFFWVLLTLLIASALVLGACGAKETEEPVVEEEKFLACQVTDVGGIDDKSFNATAWKGFQDAEADFGIEGKYLESQQQTDYEANINAFIEEGCDLIVTVGYLLGDATLEAATNNPDQPFGIIDVNYLEAPNLYGSGFAVNESAFQLGYLSAALTETGIVATYGGIPIPPVTAFMDGYVLGVDYYNEVKGTDVKVLGWDVAAQDGLFVGNFESTDDGRTVGESLVDEGADIIMPVAGPVGAGTAAVFEERGTGYLIGVDNDWALGFPQYADFIIGSVMKNMDVYVYELIEATMNDEFEAGNFLGTLANGGVGIAWGGVDIPADVMAEIEDIEAGIIAGDIATLPVVEEAPADALGTEANPLIMAVVPSGETETVVTGFQGITDAVLAATGIYVEPFVATEYAGVIEAMCSDPPKAHMASLATFSYVLAAERGCAEAALVSVRYGSAVYNGQIFVRADSGIETLADLEGKTFCRPDPLSTSGWIIPSITLKAAGVDPDTGLAEIVDAGSHDASIAGVYNGDCDAGSSYVDARGNLEEDYPDVMDVIKVIEISADIPNDGVQFIPGFDPVLKEKIVAALLALVETEEGQDLLSVAYSWTALQVEDDTFYDPFRQVLDAAGVSIEEMQ
jgi:phosphate/phosphite/phosphonate ABC transporter binding protein